MKQAATGLQAAGVETREKLEVAGPYRWWALSTTSLGALKPRSVRREQPAPSYRGRVMLVVRETYDTRDRSRTTSCM